MTNLDSVLKSRDITLPTKSHLVKTMVFPVVMCGCESWTIKKAEHGRIDASELCCWKWLLRVLWTIRRSNQSILKEINPDCSVEGLILKLKLQYFGHLMWTDSLEGEETLKTGGEGDDRGWTGWMTSRTHVRHEREFEQAPGDDEGHRSLVCCNPLGQKESDMSEWVNNARPRGSFNVCNVVVQLLSVPSSLWSHGLQAHQASLPFTVSGSLLRLMSIELVMASNHFIHCCPLLLPSIFPSIRVFSSESALSIRWPKYCSFNFSISSSNGNSRLISFRIGMQYNALKWWNSKYCLGKKNERRKESCWWRGDTGALHGVS